MFDPNRPAVPESVHSSPCLCLAAVSRKSEDVASAVRRRQQRPSVAAPRRGVSSKEPDETVPNHHREPNIGKGETTVRGAPV